MLIHLVIQFFMVFTGTWNGEKSKFGFFKRLGMFFLLMLWPPAWAKHLGMMILGEARKIVANKERAEVETRRLEKREYRKKHHKGFKKASALRRAPAPNSDNGAQWGMSSKLGTVEPAKEPDESN